MVKFGKHAAAVRDQLDGACFIVDYNRLKAVATAGCAAETFVAAWRADLRSHTAWATASTRALWEQVLQKIPPDSARGVPPEEALQMFVQICAGTRSESATHVLEPASLPPSTFALDSPADLLRLLKRLELACATNCESLRKAIKKFDKLVGQPVSGNDDSGPANTVSHALLPELYSSTSTTGPSQFRAMIQIVTSAMHYQSHGTPLAVSTKHADARLMEPASATSFRRSSRKKIFSMGEIPMVSLVRLRSKARNVRRKERAQTFTAGSGSDHQHSPTSLTEASASEGRGGSGENDPAENVNTNTSADGEAGDGTPADRLAQFRAMQIEFDNRRREELLWLHGLSRRLSESFISKLVLHRGFHSGMDGGDRPIENSLTAYESAWSAGIKYCECDIALTADEYLVLCHDANFKRLALFGGYPTSASESEVDAAASARAKVAASTDRDRRRMFNGKKAVGDMTYREIIGMPLKSGQRPPLLEDVLESALAIGGGAQLVIEIKKGNPRSASALVQLFSARPKLLNAVAVVMSFDLWVIHEFNKNFRSMVVEDARGHGAQGIAGAGEDDLGDVGDVGTSQAAGSTIPKVLLLTVSEKTDEAPYLFLSVHGDEGDRSKPSGDADAEYAQVQAQLKDWIVTDDSVLDGVYLQLEESMVKDGSPGRRTLRQLAERHCVGVWGRVNGADPDDEGTAASLMDAGVAFVNTDLPRSFFNGSK